MHSRPFLRSAAAVVLATSLLGACSDHGQKPSASPSTTTTSTTASSSATVAPGGIALWSFDGSPPRLEGESLTDPTDGVEVYVGFHHGKLLPAATFDPGGTPRAGNVLVVPVVLVDKRAKPDFGTGMLINAYGPFTGEGKGNDAACLLEGHAPGALVSGPTEGKLAAGGAWTLVLASSSCIATAGVTGYQVAALTPTGNKRWPLTES